MKKTILLSIIAASLMADISIGEFKMKNPVMSAENLSVEHGGTKSMIDAYSDGVGVIIVGDYGIADNTAVNNLVYKYGEGAKKASASLPDYVLGLASASAEDKVLAQKIKDNLANSQYLSPGDSCDDGDPNTVFDTYNNNQCSGYSQNLTQNDIANFKFSFGYISSELLGYPTSPIQFSIKGYSWINTGGVFECELKNEVPITKISIQNYGYYESTKGIEVLFSDDGINFTHVFAQEHLEMNRVYIFNIGFHGAHKFWKVKSTGAYDRAYSNYIYHNFTGRIIGTLYIK